MSFVLVVRMKVAAGNEERAAELIPELASASAHFQRLGAGELFGLMESRERVFYETVVD